MAETERLFDTDSDLTEFTGTVLSCESDGKLYKVVLDRTAFFPEEGGQTCDKGTLNGINVEKVREKDRVIYHWLKKPLEPGDVAAGAVDWKKRFWDMQQHSGEHIVSGLVHSVLGYDNVGFHLGSDYVTMDYNGSISREQMTRIETMANEAVAQNLPVKVSFPTREELAHLQYRSKKEIDGQIRIVEIPGYDICACCAPHVHRTGEIGMIKITGMERYKGGERVYMLCGFRALDDYRAKLQSVSDISAQLSARPDKVAAAVRALSEESAALRQELNLVKMDILQRRIDSIPASTENVCLFDEYLDKKNMRRAWTAMTERFEGLCGSFAGDDESGYQFVLGGRNCNAVDMGRIITSVLDGKGGGSPEMYQGKLASSRSEIEAWFADLKDME